MSKFYGEILTDVTYDTNVRLANNVIVKYVRAHLLKFGTLIDGQVELSLYQGSTELKTVSIDHIEMNAISEQPYAHGWFKFELDVPLHHNPDQAYTEYTIKIRAINNTNRDIWLVSDLNEPIVPAHDTTSIYARGFEIYTIQGF